MEFLPLAKLPFNAVGCSMTPWASGVDYHGVLFVA
jgi:hypothetical protein